MFGVEGTGDVCFKGYVFVSRGILLFQEVCFWNFLPLFLKELTNGLLLGFVFWNWALHFVYAGLEFLS